MKKIMMIAVMAVAAISANAQVYVGGSLGYNTQKDAVEVGGISTDETTSNLSIEPEIGYNLSDNWAVGIKLGYANANGKTNTWKVAPYARYTFVKAGKFSAFCDGGVAWSTIHTNGAKFVGNKNCITIGFNPGIAYEISKKVSLVAHFGDLSYQYTSQKTKDVTPETKTTTSKFNLGLDNSISFGAYYNF